MESLGFESAGQLGPRANAELPKDVPQVELDCLRRHEQGGGDLLVPQALGDELGDLELGRGQPAARSRTATDPRELRLSPLDPPRSA